MRAALGALVALVAIGGTAEGQERVLRCGPGPAWVTESPVDLALRWLARHQNADGSWGASSFLSQCVGVRCVGEGDSEYDVGLTGLSLVAFLRAGFTHESRDTRPDPGLHGRTLKYGEIISSGLKWLLSNQDPEGCFGRRGTRHMYNHLIAALALSDAYGLTGNSAWRAPAAKAIEFILASQNPGRGWRYSKLCGDNDTSVTGWAILALKSAEFSGLATPAPDVYDGARVWLDEVTDRFTQRAGYNALKESPPVCREIPFKRHDSMTAVSVACRVLLSKGVKDPALDGVGRLVADLPRHAKEETDYYYWFWGSIALFLYDGPTGSCWRLWNEPLKNALTPHQARAGDGCAHGSWTSDDERWGFEGGRVYATAINALTLEVYYRYLNVFQGWK